MNNYSFFVPFFLHLLFGAFFICGFFSITRGAIELLPDGTKRKNGKIFKAWYFFWFREVGKNKLFYAGQQLENLLLQVQTSNVNKFTVIDKGESDKYIVISGSTTQDTIREMEMRFNIKLLTKRIVDDTIIYFYKEEPAYFFPWYLRDMMAGCITCHSSWLGTLLFFSLYQVMEFSQFSWPLLIFAWISYCVSLAFVTTALWRKYMA